jgi:uncharacterized protein YcbX
MDRTYSVSSLWRYPVKSMAGEELEAERVTARGLRGDRAYALVDAATGRVGSAKSVKLFGELLKCRAAFVSPPEYDDRMPPVRITLADGTVVESGEPDAVEKLNAAFGPRVSLVSSAPAGLMLGFAAGTLGGKHAETTAIPVSSEAAPGTLFDYASIHLVTTATLARLQTAYPDGRFTLARFRPNIVVDCPGETGFVENSWTGRTLTIGSELVLRVSIPCPRCVMTTLPHADLPPDPRILRTIAEQNRVDLGDFGNLPCVGVYADVVQPGSLRRGDPVLLGS